MAKESGRKSKKSSKATCKRRGKTSSSLTFETGGTSRAYEAAGAGAASMVTSLLNSFVRDVISAGLTSAAALLTAMGKYDKDDGGESARPVTRSVKFVASRSRRKPAASSGATVTEERALPTALRKGAAKASSAPTKKKRSDAGVKRAQRRKSESAESGAAPSSHAEEYPVVRAAVLSAAKPQERSAPKAGRKRSAPSSVVRTRRKRSDAGAKRVPAQNKERANLSVATTPFLKAGSRPARLQMRRVDHQLVGLAALRR